MDHYDRQTIPEIKRQEKRKWKKREEETFDSIEQAYNNNEIQKTRPRSNDIES